MIVRLKWEISKRSFIFRYYVTYAFFRSILMVILVTFSPPYQPEMYNILLFVHSIFTISLLCSLGRISQAAIMDDVDMITVPTVEKNTDPARANNALSRLTFCDFVRLYEVHQVSLLSRVLILRGILHIYYIMEILHLFTITTLFYIYEVICENS